MAATFANPPVTFAFSGSGSPTDNITARPSGDNRKLIFIMMTRDAETWDISTMTIGGQSASTTFSIPVVDLTQLAAFEWDEVKIAAMSGVAISYADVSAFINPIGSTHYWVKDADQTATVQVTGTANNTDEVTVATTANVSGDLVVGALVVSDDVPAIDDYDTLTEHQQQHNGQDIVCGIASSTSTADTSHVFGIDGVSFDFAAAVYVHTAAAAGGTALLIKTLQEGHLNG